MRRSLVPLALLLAAPFANAQFAPAVDGPGPQGDSDNVDFGDVDLDGDWDAAFARGGETFNRQNMLWINQGGEQGATVGTFADETALRFPAAPDATRDLEFADIDADGDLDLYVANHAQITNQGSRWWVNQGGEQGGGLGFYADDTADRWIRLGGPGSSISPALVLPDTFIDWPGDADFADLDNDGDLDLVHASYGGSFSGQTPTRLFLNDGDGRFEEFNPSGFQLTTSQIAQGDPAIWAEGLQAANTTDTTGAFADVTATSLDVEPTDIDGDLDLDLFLGSRQSLPRLFVNRLEENGGSLSFRDESAARFPLDYALNMGNYDQEFGDLDGDGDLDLYGLNWAGFDDRTFLNDGNGFFSFFQDPIPDSGSDDNESDFLDYDSDGDLDVFVANWSGADKLYQNDGSGQLTLVQSIPGFPSITLDADAADIDNDGDQDVVRSHSFGPEQILVNLTDVPDTTGATLPVVEALADAPAATDPRPVRAQVVDNAPYYITWYNRVEAALSVEGFAWGTVPARSSGGQVFRAELPGNLVGSVAYRFRSFDQYENLGVSGEQTYLATAPAPFAVAVGAPTPGAGGAPALHALSVPFAGTDFALGADGFAPGSVVAFYLAADALAAPIVLPGLVDLWIGGPILLERVTAADATGRATTIVGVPPGLAPGFELAAQAFGADLSGPVDYSATAALAITTQ